MEELIRVRKSRVANYQVYKVGAAVVSFGFSVEGIYSK